MNHCHSCGAAIKRRKKECPHCGASLLRTARKDEPVQAETTESQIRTPSVEETPSQERKVPWQVTADDIKTEKSSDEWFFPVSDRVGKLIWGFIGFIVPPVGFIMYYGLMDKKPSIAYFAGMGAIIGLVAFFFAYMIIASMFGFVPITGRLM